MKRNDYVNAVNKLQFSDDLYSRVRVSGQGRTGFSLLRAALVAAVLCLILATTAVAAGKWMQWNVDTEKIGTVEPDTEYAPFMTFTEDADMDGIRVHTMKLNRDPYFLFGHGLFYSNESGFLQVEQDYSLTELESRELSLSLEKDGFSYRHNLRFVETDHGLVSHQMFYYPLVDGRALVNLWHSNERCWPVWVDVATGEWEDALPNFHVEDFGGDISYIELFRDGIILSCQGNANYWIAPGSDTAVKIEIPRGAVDYKVDGEIYLRDANGAYFKTQGDWEFHPIEDIPRTSDDLWRGLVTCVSDDRTLQIYDPQKGVMYNIPDISAYDPWIQEDPQCDPDLSGFNSTRYSTDGSIVVTHTYEDWENLRRMVDSIAYLDQETMELKQLDIEADTGVWTHGWLDEHRYCVISEDGICRWLTVYEFDA